MALSEEAATLFREQWHIIGLGLALEIQGLAALMREDYEKARAFLVESLALYRKLGDKRGTINSIEGLACSAAQGEAEHAARLFGPTEALRETGGYRLAPSDRALLAPYLEVTRSRLGEPAWEAAFAEGQAMKLEEAVEYALSEELPVPESSAPEQPSASMRVSTLTRREEEISILMARGLTNRQIASELSISEHTVATHVRWILKKTGFHSRAQLAAWVSEQ